jgi:hypothetical protein
MFRSRTLRPAPKKRGGTSDFIDNLYSPERKAEMLALARKHFPIETGATDEQLMQIAHALDVITDQILDKMFNAPFEDKTKQRTEENPWRLGVGRK